MGATNIGFDSMSEPPISAPVLARKWLLFTFIAIALWGVWATLSKFTSATVDPYTTQFYFSAGLVPILIVLWRRNGFGSGKSARGAFWGFVTGIFGGLGNVAFFGALGNGGAASIVTPSASLAPLFTLLLAVLALRERPNWKQWCGLMLSIVALYFLSI